MLADTSVPRHAYLGIEMPDDGMGPEIVDTLVGLPCYVSTPRPTYMNLDVSII